MVSEERISRRNFIKGSFGSLLILFFPHISFLEAKSELIVTKGKRLPTLDRYIKRGKSVFIKPNGAWARRPEQAATTNPEILKEVIKLCYEAGADKVYVWEHSCDNHKFAFEKNRIKDVAKKSRAYFYSGHTKKLYEKITIEKGKVLKSALVPKILLDSETFINIPIAKHHAATTLTCCLKNLMGCTWDMGKFHKKNLHQAIVDINTCLKPTLNIVDATRILKTNGPKGPGQVEFKDTIIIGEDGVACDAYASTLFGWSYKDIPHLKIAEKMGIGNPNYTVL